MKHIIDLLPRALVLTGLALAGAGVAFVFSGARHREAFQRFEHCITANVRTSCTLTSDSSDAGLPAEEYQKYYRSQFTVGWPLLAFGVSALLLSLTSALRRRASLHALEAMKLSPDQLRSHYQGLSDKALRRAQASGPESYQVEVWRALQAEVAIRDAQAHAEDEALRDRSIEDGESIAEAGSATRGRMIVTAIAIVFILLSLAAVLAPGSADQRLRLFAGLCVTIALGGQLYRGRNWARITLGAFAGVGGVLGAGLGVAILLGGWPSDTNSQSHGKLRVLAARVLALGLIYLCAAVLLFFSSDVRAYTTQKAGSGPQA